MRRTFLAIAASLLFLSACATPERRSEPANLFWPLPPEKPRIRYIQSIYSEDDIGRIYSFREMLFGKSYRDSLTRPYGVFARGEKIYVTDITAMRVMVYDRKLKRVLIVGEEGAMHIPSAALADSKGTLYVADASRSKIVVYDAGGSYQTAFPLGSVKPVALAFNESLGRLFVLDRNGHRVVVLNTAGGLLFEFGAPGRDDGQFNMPLGMAIDKNGRIYVLDSGNFRVQIFDADGRFITKFGSVGDRAGFFANPKGIAVDSDGHIYVTDAAFGNFQIFDQEGMVLLSVGKLGPAPGQLYLPAGIAIDENDRIYIADQLNSRISIFQYLKAVP
jgi:DNA-binding beta-propeller fold protein YncE